jgi:Amt family ammonium transporter
MGFHDFAGSTAVHMVGGVAALVGAKILGPRLGKYDEDGKINAIPGHRLTLGALGVFILWFAWFGFNGCSTVSATGDKNLLSMGTIFVNTNMAAAAASTATMIFTWLRYGKPDVSMTLNGALAGLVAITAGCDAVSPAGACIIGVIAGIVIVFAVEFVDQGLKIDDPVGAVSVHGVCGALGTLLTGFFAVDGGLLYGGGSKLLITQLTGVLSVMAWVAVTMVIVFKLIEHTIGLRVSEDEEITGLDLEEHGLASSYADFMPVIESKNLTTKRHDTSKQEVSPVPMEDAVPVVYNKPTPASGDHKLTKIVIITAQLRFEALKTALDKIGITGMTVTKVLGYGIQKGNMELYRGAEVAVHLLPKVKVELVVSKVPVREVIDVAKKVLYTGKYGDGKIFVFDVENVIKIRTGEEGYAALQDNEI